MGPAMMMLEVNLCFIRFTRGKHVSNPNSAISDPIPSILAINSTSLYRRSDGRSYFAAL